jgi:hypothetical protein
VVIVPASGSPNVQPKAYGAVPPDDALASKLHVDRWQLAVKLAATGAGAAGGGVGAGDGCSVASAPVYSNRFGEFAPTEVSTFGVALPTSAWATELGVAAGFS